ncbi:MAG: hypothetical protein ACI87J_002057 [Colwellia sp.]|jgi:hypothetical protein
MMDPLFKVITFGRVGTVAINSFLDQHPEISAPWNEEVYKEYATKVGKLSNLPFLKNEKIKANGLVIHHQEFLRDKMNYQLNQLAEYPANKIIHLVRHPADQVLSWINHCNASAIIGSGGWKYIKPTARSLFKEKKAVVEALKSGQIANYFYQKDSKIKLVDFDSLKSNKISSTMKDIYQFLNVDESFSSESFFQRQNNIAEELLLQGISFNLNGEVIEVGFRLLSRIKNIFENDPRSHGKFEPWVTLNEPDFIVNHCPDLPPVNGKICVIPKNITKYNQLKNETKKILHENLTSIIPEIMGEWAKRANEFGKKIKKAKIDKLSDEDREYVMTMLADDLKIFTNYYPEYTSKWAV